MLERHKRRKVVSWHEPGVLGVIAGCRSGDVLPNISNYAETKPETNAITRLYEEQGKQSDAAGTGHGSQCRMRKVLMQGL
jgi:hypothetical protein